MTDDTYKNMIFFAVLFAMVVTLGILFFVMLTDPVDAHEWYEYSCCSESDCKPVPNSVVTDTPDGGVDVDFKGFHGHLQKNSGKIKKSQDVRDHVCIHDVIVNGGPAKTQSLICVYRADRGV